MGTTNPRCDSPVQIDSLNCLHSIHIRKPFQNDCWVGWASQIFQVLRNSIHVNVKYYFTFPISRHSQELAVSRLRSRTCYAPDCRSELSLGGIHGAMSHGVANLLSGTRGCAVKPSVALLIRSVTPPSDPAGTRTGPVSHRQAWPPSSVAALPQPELSDPARFLPPNSPESYSSSG